MTTIKKKTGIPAWTVRRTAFNFGEMHAKMIDELLAKAKETNHRANMTTVIEKAIEELHKTIQV